MGSASEVRTNLWVSFFYGPLHRDTSGLANQPKTYSHLFAKDTE